MKKRLLERKKRINNEFKKKKGWEKRKNIK